MYELIEIIENDATRIIKLKNTDTNEIEECFDDSELVCEKNFGFMQIGQKYECKIKLFGNPVIEKSSNSVICTFINKDIVIGQKTMVEVKIKDSKYYIMKQKVKNFLDNESFNFCFTRKDLIQVNDVIHADLL